MVDDRAADDGDASADPSGRARAWLASFGAVATLVGVEPVPPEGWVHREGRARHVCRLLSDELDAAAPGSTRRCDLARAYARAFALLVEAGRQRVETVRPPPGGHGD